MKKLAMVAIAAAAAASLAGCEKPAPRVTVFSGSASEWVAPVCFSAEGQLDAQQCLTDAASKAAAGQTPRLTVAQGNTVGISVDPAIAESGWMPMIAGQQLAAAPLTSTYFRFTFPEGNLNAEQFPLTVMSTGAEKGVWAVRMDVQR